MKIVNINFDGPIQRIIGGGIIVPVQIDAETESGNYSISSFSVALSDSEADIDEAYSRAVTKAKNQLAETIESVKIGIKIQTELMKELSVAKSVELIEELKSGNKYTAETIEALNKPARSGDQDRVWKLCETLGIPRIDVSAENGFTFLYARSLIKELERKAQMFSVDLDRSSYSR